MTRWHEDSVPGRIRSLPSILDVLRNRCGIPAGRATTTFRRTSDQACRITSVRLRTTGCMDRRATGLYRLPASLNVPSTGGLAATPGSCRRIAEGEMNTRNGRDTRWMPSG
jgi:hypothetical protein